MFKVKVLVFSLLLVFATNVFAGDVDPCESETGQSCSPMMLNICPFGDMENIFESCTTAIEDTHYVYIYVRDVLGNGVAGIPGSDYWLGACDSQYDLCLCAEPIVADYITNDEGYTEFSGTIAGGGCVNSGGIYIAVQGKIIQEAGCTGYDCVDMIIKSPDLTADCQVNLSDLSAFGLTYTLSSGDTDYNSCADYNDDDSVNLSDLSFFGIHYLHTCQ